ncbi:MAG: aminopeptidase P N-terminal domain-containing protein [Planctomycetes bacterium]|nr:aminopeptidase P N-terminal domain-containing protein [Planctomycetota bacterium]
MASSDGHSTLMFIRHRQAFLDRMEEGDLALFPGAELVTRNHDVDFPFRQHSDFWYLTGLREPSGMLMLAKGISDVPDETLFLQPRDELAEIWNGKRLGAEGAMEQLGFVAAAPVEGFRSRFVDLLPRAKRLWVSLGSSSSFDQIVLAAMAELRGKIRLGLEPPQILVDPRPELAQMRLYKSDEELELMRRAAAISSEAHTLAMAQCRPGMNECELEALIHYTFRRHGCDDAGWAYPSIVASGDNACILHYTNNDQPMRDGDVVLIDAGAEYRSYGADITRTFPVNGKFTPAQRDVYEVVLAAQKASLDFSRPGCTHAQVHEASVRTLADGLVQLKVLDESVDEIIERQTYRRWYMHNTGHWLGLDVHDAGRYREGGESVDLAPGMVMTIEPGLYFQSGDEGIPAELRGIGVRIEDAIHITGGAPEVLTAATPKEVAEVEEACANERAEPPTLEMDKLTQ